MSTENPALFQRLGRIIAKRFIPLIAGLPAPYVKNILLQIITRKAERLEPRQAASFLLELDNALYPLHSQAAVRYGGGVHPKHSLTRYHDFFVQRIGPGDRVLDVGCRTGEVAFEIANRTGAKVTGIDIDTPSLEEGRRRNVHPNIEFLEGDAYTWVPPHSFDVVVMSNVLEHLKDRVDLLEGLQERTKATRFLVRVPLFERDWRAGLKRELGLEWRLDHTHETEYTLESFKDEMSQAGFEIGHLEVRWGEIWAELKAKIN
ncbi:MAG: class I SAM-dependent methyltransferase [Chloroflexi bacterium]|nr:class I SAM-dependent methyltransferase [Chloroflexota bacterium]